VARGASTANAADVDATTAGRRLRLRYPAVCSGCAVALRPGTEAWWNREAGEATCLDCVEAPVANVAGASAAAEGERRVARRVQRVEARYGAAAAAVAEHVAAREIAASWGKGSEGESRLAAFVARELGDAVVALHDRQIPGTRSNIDHLFVAPSGVWVVDGKAHRGRLECRDSGSLFRPRNELYVGGRNRTKLAKGVEKQIECVLAALRLEPEAKGTPVHGALCFVEAEWKLLDFAFQVDGVWVLYPGALRKRLRKNGPLNADTMRLVAAALGRALPPAGRR
jgi:hypothetical protein